MTMKMKLLAWVRMNMIKKSRRKFVETRKLTYRFKR
jgi:hypothetical protein